MCLLSATKSRLIIVIIYPVKKTEIEFSIQSNRSDGGSERGAAEGTPFNYESPNHSAQKPGIIKDKSKQPDHKTTSTAIANWYRASEINSCSKHQSNFCY